MPVNVEIKARVKDPAALRRRAEAVAGPPAAVLRQTDVFFSAPSGRLKLRRFPEGPGELIFYERPDRTGPKESRYSVYRTGDAGGLERTLREALEVIGMVRKTRTLFLAGRARIHLDEVEGLGSFMELEVVMEEGEAREDGEAETARLMDALGIGEEDLVEGAYLDLLREGGKT